MSIHKAKQSTQGEFRNDLIRLGFELETNGVAGYSYGQLDRFTKKVNKTREIPAIPVTTAESMFCSALNERNQVTFRKSLRYIKKAGDLVRENQGAFGDVLYNGAYCKISDLLAYSKTGLYSAFASHYGCIARLAVACNDPDLKAKLLKLHVKVTSIYQTAAITALRYNTETKTETYEEDEPVELDEALEIIGISAPVVEAFEWKPDGSVQGPEIVTKGPNSYAEACLLATQLFENISKIGFSVNHGCSFHIHASVVDASPRYSGGFQAFLMRELLNDPRVPASVRERWKSEALERYFGFNLNNDKYCFVAFRGRTWEFRAFGNVSNAADAIVCLTIASDAYHKALTAQSVSFDLPIGISFQKIASHAAKNGITFDESLNYFRNLSQEAA